MTLILSAGDGVIVVQHYLCGECSVLPYLREAANDDTFFRPRAA